MDRKSRTYQYYGSGNKTPFIEVEEGTEGGFLKGKIITEYDLNLSMRFYFMEPDFVDVIESVVFWGQFILTVNLLADASVIVAANLQAIVYYCQGFGVKEGLSMYRTLGTQYVPDGLLSVIQSYEGEAKAQYGDEFGKMGKYVEHPDVEVDWSQYSQHGLEQMEKRGLTKGMVDSFVKNGKALSQSNGEKFAFVTKKGVAVVTKDGKLITAWGSSNFDSNMVEIIKKLFGD